MSTAKKVVRKAQGTGKWFPGGATELTGMIAHFLAETYIDEVKDPIVAAISPHAGYIYSGPVAGYTYRALKDNAEIHGHPETVVVLGFSHRGDTRGVALMDGSAFSTPLGETPLDADAANLLIAADSRISRDIRPHVGEHSLENQVPFIQTVFPRSALVMALIGQRDSEFLGTLSTALTTLAGQKKILVLASSDMLHDPSYERVRKRDQATLKKVVAMDDSGVMHDWDYSQQVFCGIGPVVTAMKYARKRGCQKATLLRYRNSGDDHPESRGQWVVGYGAVVFTIQKKA